ncbi:cupredoxin domain-containing protein [Corynebacterium fournieri]|uniref:cupredoxin domain-containing protein n=1 Tax=Corynebacterium fournieri TaxID=1852390 RepID=UPI000A2F30EF|nr:cupredoxin domain-containing protein [Corynebacterium fournieri]WJY96498.1 hypothetical protein CFOUR_00235 [Corynebacterium fournieri]
MTRRTQPAAWAITAAILASAASTSALVLPKEGDIPTGDDVVTAEVRIERMHYIPDRIEVPRGTKLVVNLVNDGEKEHDLKIGDANSGRLTPGETSTTYFGEFNVDTLGWCTIAGHKTMGMTFRVDVT